ncbi:MAG: DUF58 domain-containing protein [Armatimonadetes bacterium]|nr:DUF58 domain-containing protein [Armatimonadota bacterium]
MAAIVLALSYVLRIGFFTYALYVVLALLVMSALISRHGLAGITHKRYCAVQRARLGESVDVRIEIRHEGRWPVPWVLVEDLVPAALGRAGEVARVAALWPKQTLGLRYSLRCDRRGYHQIGPLLLETGDLFGLVRRFEAGERAHYLIVHPEVVPIGGYDVASPRPIGEVRVQRRGFEDPSRLRGVRDYQPGDKLSRIHWRSSARTGRLQTKIYEPTVMIGALVVLDMFAPAYEEHAADERSELAVTAAASLATYVSHGGQRAGFLSNGRDAADRARYDDIELQAATRWQAERMAQMREHSDRLRPFEVTVGPGPTTLQRILDATARVELSDFQPLGRMLLREYPRLARDVSILVLTPRVDQALLEAVAAMRKSGFVMSVLVVGNSAGYAAARGKLLAEGVPAYDLLAKHHLRELAAVRL